MITLLRAGRVVRGRVIDPFGHAEIRRIERQLPAEYQSAIETVLVSLNASNLASAVEIANLPDQVRGYENLKLTRVAEYRSSLEAKLAAI